MNWRTVAPMLLCLAACKDTTSTDTKLAAEAALLDSWTVDATLISAITAQNALNLPLTTIQARDTAWVAGHAAALVTEMTTNACAARLRALAALRPEFGESFVMDNQGALVCATNPTSDYWQGDEAKWQKSFNNGAGGTFIDSVQLDASSNTHLAQISRSISSNGKVVGALTVGIKVDLL